MKKENKIENTGIIMIYCPICFKNFNSEVKIITLNCGHYFCADCLGNSNFQTFFKCCVCRSINTSYDFSNCDILNLFNFVYSEYRENQNNNNNIDKDYCKECKKLILFPKYHIKEYPSHQLIKQENLFQILNSCKLQIKVIEEQFSLINFEDKIKSDLNYKNFRNYSNKFNLENLRIVSNKLIEESENKIKIEDIKTRTESKRELMNKMISFQKCIKKLKNKSLHKDINEIILKSQKNLNLKIFQKISSKKFIQCYIKNTKNIVIFDVDSLEVNMHVIKDLPFNFYKSSHSVEYDNISNKIYISGGKQDNFLYSNMSNKIWEFSIDEEICKNVQNLEHEITDHRSIIINEDLYIIGGKKGIKDFKSEIFYNKIYKMDINSHTIEKKEINLKYPRSNFGIAYDNMQIYICFGLTTAGNYLNSIEILNLYCPNNSTVLIDFGENIISNKMRLKDIGVIIDYEYDKMIILGGQRESDEKNSTIFYFDLKDYKYLNSTESKEIVSGVFTTYGTKFNSISAILSNNTINDELPHIYLFSDMNKKWTCHSIDIYYD